GSGGGDCAYAAPHPVNISGTANLQKLAMKELAILRILGSETSEDRNNIPTSVRVASKRRALNAVQHDPVRLQSTIFEPDLRPTVFLICRRAAILLRMTRQTLAIPQIEGRRNASCDNRRPTCHSGVCRAGSCPSNRSARCCRELRGGDSR